MGAARLASVNEHDVTTSVGASGHLPGVHGTLAWRRPLTSDGRSGARLEQVQLEDGRRLVVKHVDPASDWIALATGDVGRVFLLWSSGVFDRVPGVIDHAVLAVGPAGEHGSKVVMRDVSADLFASGRRLSRADSRRILAAAAELHRTFRRGSPPDGLTPLAELYRFLSPSVAARFARDAAVPALALRGWDRFGDLVPDEVADAVAHVHEHPETLARLLTRRTCTLVHGDLKLANLGLRDGRVVVLDWGSLTTWAPAAVDLAWFLAINAASIDATHDDLLADVRAAGGADHDEEALRLALLGALAQLGWEKALGATDSPDERVRQRERAGLAWWSARVRETIEALDSR
jgi:thiamine kinase-like enzyme